MPPAEADTFSDGGSSSSLGDLLDSSDEDEDAGFNLRSSLKGKKKPPHISPPSAPVQRRLSTSGHHQRRLSNVAPVAKVAAATKVVDPQSPRRREKATADLDFGHSYTDSLAVSRPGVHEHSLSRNASLDSHGFESGHGHRGREKIANVKDLKSLLNRELRRGSGGNLALAAGLQPLHSPEYSRRPSLVDAHHADFVNAPHDHFRSSLTRRGSNHFVESKRHSEEGGRRMSIGLSPAQQNLRRMSFLPGQHGHGHHGHGHHGHGHHGHGHHGHGHHGHGHQGHGHQRRASISLHHHEVIQDDDDHLGTRKCFVKMLMASTGNRNGNGNGKTDSTSIAAQHAATVKRMIARSKDMQVEVYEKLTHEEDPEGDIKKKSPAAKERLRQKAANRLRHSRQVLIQTRLAENYGTSSYGSQQVNEREISSNVSSFSCSRRDKVLPKSTEEKAVDTMPAGMTLLGAVSEESDHHRKHHLNAGERSHAPRKSKDLSHVQIQQELSSTTSQSSKKPHSTSNSQQTSRRISVMDPLAQDQIDNLIKGHNAPQKWWKIIEVPRIRTRFRAEHDKQILSDQFEHEFMTRRRIFRAWATELALQAQECEGLDVYLCPREDMEALALKQMEVRRDVAAKMIQAQWHYKNFRTKEQLKKQDETAAVIMLQRMWKQKVNYELPLRRRLQDRVNKMITLRKLQACYRGYAARKKVDALKELRNVAKEMDELQAKLGPPIHIVVRVQALIRGFLARRAAREQATRDALRTVVAPSEGAFSPSVDDTIGQRDLCRSRTSVARMSRQGSKAWGSQYLAERRRSMAVGILSSKSDSTRKSLKRTGSVSARSSMMGGSTNPFIAFDEELSNASTRASTRSSVSPGHLSARVPSRMGSTKSCRSSILKRGQTFGSPSSKSCRSSLLMEEDDSILELRESKIERSPPPRRPVTVPLGASPDSEASSPPPVPRTSAVELEDVPAVRRPHSSCSYARWRTGSLSARQVAVPSGPVRESSSFRRSYAHRASTPRV